MIVKFCWKRHIFFSFLFCWLLLLLLLLLNDVPQLLRCEGHVNVRDTKGISDGIGHSRCRTNGTGLTYTFDTKRVISASPVSLSISTTQTWVPKGKTQASGSKKTVVSRPGSMPGARVLERLAAAATSLNVTAFCGEPATENLPSSNVTSDALASSIWDAICVIFSLSR